MGRLQAMRVGVLLGVALFALLAADAASSDLGDGSDAVLSPLDEHGDLGSEVGRRAGRISIRRNVRGGGGPGMSTYGNFHMSAFQGNHEGAMLGDTGRRTTRKARLGEGIDAELSQLSRAQKLSPEGVKHVKKVIAEIVPKICKKTSSEKDEVASSSKIEELANGKKKLASAAASVVDFSDGAWSWVATYNDAKSDPKTKGRRCQTKIMTSQSPKGNDGRFYECILLKKEYWQP